MAPKKSTAATPEKTVAQQPTPAPSTQRSRRAQGIAAPESEADVTSSKKSGRASFNDDDGADEVEDETASPRSKKRKPPAKPKAPAKATASAKTSAKAPTTPTPVPRGRSGLKSKSKMPDAAKIASARGKSPTFISGSDEDDGGKPPLVGPKRSKTDTADAAIVLSSDKDDGGKPPRVSPKGKGKAATFASVDEEDGGEYSRRSPKGKGKAVDKSGRKRAAASVEGEPAVKRPRKAESLSEWKQWAAGAEGLSDDESPEEFTFDRGSFRQMTWADDLFNATFKEPGPERRRALSNFEAIRALAMSLEEDGVLDFAQKNNLVRHWLHNSARLPGTARDTLVEWELDEDKKHYPEEALDEFSRTKYPAALLALRKRDEITVHEMDTIIALWATANEDLIQNRPADQPLRAHKEGLKYYNDLLKEVRWKEGIAERRGKPEPDTSLGHYTYVGSLKTPMHAVPPGMRRKNPTAERKRRN